MKKLFLFLIVCLPGFSLLAQESSEISTPPDGENQKAEVSQWIGPVKISIAYHSPRVHFKGAERTGHIWGELVQYGFFDDGFGPSKAMPWRAGANENTTITFSHDVKVDSRQGPMRYSSTWRRAARGIGFSRIARAGGAVTNTTPGMMRCAFRQRPRMPRLPNT
jgi:Protein of unknown function (DUF2911)